MHYPWWYVPIITSPMLIAAHRYISHVRGDVRRGRRAVPGRRDPLCLSHQEHCTSWRIFNEHAWFFILLTVVFGAITGVGIWWTIGLASPLATEALIHIFVFGWAMEYVFFVLEIVSAFIFFYYWGRLDPKTHQLIGWIYAVSAWISLVLITAITAFMLNPGAWPQTPGLLGRRSSTRSSIPQTLARTGGALLLASLYVYLHAVVRTERSESLRTPDRPVARPGRRFLARCWL